MIDIEDPKNVSKSDLPLEIVIVPQTIFAAISGKNSRDPNDIIHNAAKIFNIKSSKRNNR